MPFPRRLSCILAGIQGVRCPRKIHRKLGIMPAEGHDVSEENCRSSIANRKAARITSWHTQSIAGPNPVRPTREVISSPFSDTLRQAESSCRKTAYTLKSQIARRAKTARGLRLSRLLFSMLSWKTLMIRADFSTDIARKDPATTVGVGIRTLST
jgi:exonuclease III